MMLVKFAWNMIDLIENNEFKKIFFYWNVSGKKVKLKCGN